MAPMETKIISIGSVRTYGGKAHLALKVEYTGDDVPAHLIGLARIRIPCSCKGTANGQMGRGAYHEGMRPTCKPSLKLLAGESPIAKAAREFFK